MSYPAPLPSRFETPAQIAHQFALTNGEQASLTFMTMALPFDRGLPTRRGTEAMLDDVRCSAPWTSVIRSVKPDDGTVLLAT